MANGFYNDAVEMDTKNSPWSMDVEKQTIDSGSSGEEGGVKTGGLTFFYGKDSKLYAPSSIMNDNVAINYRTISNAYPIQTASPEPFTEYSDYLKCMSKQTFYKQFQKDKRNPTYETILKYYSNENFDKEGLSRYKIQDFIYLKYYNQIPNNYMITLRRYTQPCEDHMFGLDMSAPLINDLHDRSNDYFAIATAVTYMGEQTGNKLSDILKFEYGMNWESKTAEVTSLQSSDGGLAAQMDQLGVNRETRSATAGFGALKHLGSVLATSAMMQGKGLSVEQGMARQHAYNGNEFESRYGNEFYGDVNVIQNVKLRSRGLTFTNNFTLTFEYSLKSLKCVNPRVAMMDILSNFLILTGNYGQFWGGATLFFGAHNIAPQFGDPSLLRQGKYGAYLNSLWKDVKTGFNHLAENKSGEKGGNLLESLLNVGKNIISGGFTALIGNIFGGSVGVAGTSQAPPALLSGKPSGYWHVTVGNPLDPIAMMGNMAVNKTTVQFGDVLGYDDFPTEIKFMVEMEHCKPRDNAAIENMFNAGKGRFYTFANKSLESAYHNVNTMNNFKLGDGTQEVNSRGNGSTNTAVGNHGSSTPVQSTERMKIIGGQLNP